MASNTTTVTMNKSTYCDGQRYRIGEKYIISDALAERWCKNGLCTADKPKQTRSKPAKVGPDDEL